MHRDAAGEQQLHRNGKLQSTAAGAAAGTLTFAGNLSNTGAMVNLTGAGSLNAPTFTPSSLAFGAVSVPLNTTKTVTVSNPNNAVGIPMTSVTVTALSSDYTIGTDTCSGTALAPSGMCASASLAPTTAGARAGQLTFVESGRIRQSEVRPVGQRKIALAENREHRKAAGQLARRFIFARVPARASRQPEASSRLGDRRLPTNSSTLGSLHKRTICILIKPLVVVA